MTLRGILDRMPPLGTREGLGGAKRSITGMAVALANDSACDLEASIWSADVDRPLRIARKTEAGTIWIDNWTVVRDESGHEQSGLSRLNGSSVIEYRTTLHEDAP